MLCSRDFYFYFWQPKWPPQLEKAVHWLARKEQANANEVPRQAQYKEGQEDNVRLILFA